MKFSVSAGVFEVGVPSSVWPRVPETQPPIQVLEGRETFRGQLSITEGLWTFLIYFFLPATSCFLACFESFLAMGAHRLLQLLRGTWGWHWAQSLALVDVPSQDRCSHEDHSVMNVGIYLGICLYLWLLSSVRRTWSMWPLLTWSQGASSQGALSLEVVHGPEINVRRIVSIY